MQIFLQMIPPTTTAQQKKVNFKTKTIYANSSAVDTTGVLADKPLDEELPSWQRAMKARKTPEENSNQRLNEFGIAFENLSQEHDEVTVGMLANELVTTKATVWNRLKEAKHLYQTKSLGRGKETVVTKREQPVKNT